MFQWWSPNPTSPHPHCIPPPVPHLHSPGTPARMEPTTPGYCSLMVTQYRRAACSLFSRGWEVYALGMPCCNSVSSHRLDAVSSPVSPHPHQPCLARSRFRAPSPWAQSIGGGIVKLHSDHVADPKCSHGKWHGDHSVRNEKEHGISHSIDLKLLWRNCSPLKSSFIYRVKNRGREKWKTSAFLSNQFALVRCQSSRQLGCARSGVDVRRALRLWSSNSPRTNPVLDSKEG